MQLAHLEVTDEDKSIPEEDHDFGAYQQYNCHVKESRFLLEKSVPRVKTECLFPTMTPLHEEEAKARRTSEQQKKEQGPKEYSQILIIDDNDFNQTVAKLVIEQNFGVKCD